MATMLRNVLYEKLCEKESMTDAELLKALTKDGTEIPQDRFEKLLLDLEILGLITTTWLTKDARRIEVAADDDGDDPDPREIAEDYEASFPGNGN